MNMLDLPIEMILGILHQLDVEDLLRCRLVSLFLEPEPEWALNVRPLALLAWSSAL